MKEGYTIKDQTRAHFITATVVDWIDIFSRRIYRDCLINSLSYCQSEQGELSNLLRDFKKFTATGILDLLQISPESRKEWILEHLHKATYSHSRNRNYPLRKVFCRCVRSHDLAAASIMKEKWKHIEVS